MRFIATVESCFTREDGTEFEFVFNFAAETKYSQSPKVYQERIQQLSVNCAKEAAKRNVKAFVSLSTAEMYDSDQVLSKRALLLLLLQQARSGHTNRKLKSQPPGEIDRDKQNQTMDRNSEIQISC